VLLVSWSTGVSAQQEEEEETKTCLCWWVYPFSKFLYLSCNEKQRLVYVIILKMHKTTIRRTKKTIVVLIKKKRKKGKENPVLLMWWQKLVCRKNFCVDLIKLWLIMVHWCPWRDRKREKKIEKGTVSATSS